MFTCRPEKRMISLCHWYLSESGRPRHFRNAKMPCEYLCRGDCLYGLAQTHIVADQRPAARTANSAPSA